MKTNILNLSLLLIGLLFSGQTLAAGTEPSEEGYRYIKIYTDDTVNEDGTEDIKYTTSMIVLREDALEDLKQYTISYSTSAEKVEVLEAYTQKPDGQKIDAAKNNFQITASGGRSGAAPAFSDYTSMTIIFPDLAVGDTLTLVYKKSVTAPLFPKQFSSWHAFSRSALYDDAHISYSIPLSLKARYKNFGLTEIVNKQENGRQLLTWTYKNTKVEKIEYPVSPAWKVGDTPSVILSTFPSYETIAGSYGVRAKAKAVVTKQIQELADNITKNITDPREQAHALYDWEVANLTYAGNCIGVGAVVPRDLDFVLANKMGDCKDHATLLQTLLSAKGIKSTQALIGSNSMYTLPEIPLVEVVNHVINYIPEMDLYLDATSGSPFGYLPRSLYSKPVLLVDGYRDGTKTPKRPYVISSSVIAKMIIGPDGSAKGTTTIIYKDPSVTSHAYQQQIKDTTQKQLDDSGKSLLRSSGYEGSVTVGRGQLDLKNMTYRYEISYNFKDYVYIGTPGGISVEPPFSPQSIGSSISTVISQKTQAAGKKQSYDFLCGDGASDESYEYTLPKEMNILAVPNKTSASTNVQTYDSAYTLSGQTLTIMRKLEDRTAGPVCVPEIQEEYIDLANKAWPDLKSQIVYK